MHTKTLRKKTDRQIFLKINSEHPKSLKKQRKNKKNLLDQERFDNHSREQKERFLKQGYYQTLVQEQDPIRIPFILTYNRFLPNVTTVVCKSCNILQTNKNLPDLLQEHPMIAFKRKELKNSIFPLEKENAFHVYRGQEMYIVMTTNTFTSQQTKRTFKISFNLTCKSEYVIYLLECILCKMQYVAKAETEFNLRLSNHRKDKTKESKKTQRHKENSILACKHFQMQENNFHKHAKQTGKSTRFQRSTPRNVSGKRKFLDSEAKNTSYI